MSAAVTSECNQDARPALMAVRSIECYASLSATLYLGDCLEILPQIEAADALVTDPPYGIGFDYGDGHK